MGYSFYKDLKFNLSYERLSKSCNLNTQGWKVREKKFQSNLLRADKS